MKAEQAAKKVANTAGQVRGSHQALGWCLTRAVVLQMARFWDDSPGCRHSMWQGLAGPAQQLTFGYLKVTLQLGRQAGCGESCMCLHLLHQLQAWRPQHSWDAVWSSPAQHYLVDAGHNDCLFDLACPQ